MIARAPRPHLHQSALPRGTGIVQRNFNNTDTTKGIEYTDANAPEHLRVLSSIWGWKIASSTPAVTATQAPTTICPSTLTIRTGASIGIF